MKQLTTILIILTLLIIATGCSTQTNDQNETNTTNNIALEPEEPPVQEETTTPIIPVQEEEPEELLAAFTLPKLDVQIRNIELSAVDYGEDEEYELRMILTQEQHQNLKAATIAFTPACRKATLMTVLLNNKPFFLEELTCKQNYELSIPVSDFIQGQNKLIFQSNVKDAYELTDILLTFDHGETQTYPAEDFLFQPGGADAKTFKDLDSIAFTNEIERTFKLTEEQLAKDLTFNFDIKENDGVLAIKLNNELIYNEEKLKKDDYEISLPRAYLKEGTNTLSFIVG